MPLVEEKLAKSLSAESVDLIPYLPYLLQDLWELGSAPKDMIHLLSKHIKMTPKIRVLDLACGKGAVGIQIAKKFGCFVKGIDIIPEFITEAKKKAQEYQVEALCEFIQGDINQSVEHEKDSDMVILGAVGDVLGSQEQTLIKLAKTIKRNGYVLLDDGYAQEEGNPLCMTKKEWLKVISQCNFNLVDELFVDETEFSLVLAEQIEVITKRTDELKAQYPEKASLFDAYLKSQLSECEELTTEIRGVTLLLQKKQSK